MSDLTPGGRLAGLGTIIGLYGGGGIVRGFFEPLKTVG